MYIRFRLIYIFTLYYVIRLILTLYRVIQFNTAIRVIKQIIIIIIIIINIIIIIIIIIIILRKITYSIVKIHFR